MKDWYFRRQLKSSNVCVGLYTTRISDFVFHRRRCRFPNSLMLPSQRRHALAVYKHNTYHDYIHINDHDTYSDHCHRTYVWLKNIG